jgi:alkylhydroperoxidase family enzyme
MSTSTPATKQLAPPGGWIAASGSRIEPVSPAQMRVWERVLIWAALKFKAPKSANTKLPMVFAVLMRHRRLFYAWVRFAAKLMPGGTIDRRDAELVILRVGWNCRCRYEWGQHVEIGLRTGLSAPEIARIAQGPEAPGWSPQQAALLQAVDELHGNHLLSAATWQRLSEHYRERQLIEICMLIGHYQMLAGFLNSVGLPLEPPVEEALAFAPIHPAP